MRFFSLLAAAALLTCSLNGTPARAQGNGAFANGPGQLSASLGGAKDHATPLASGLPEEVVLAGKITNPAGALPGAVVILTATRQMAVTNAGGEFAFVVPASAGPLEARVTYAGYADERMVLDAAANGATVNLANARVVVMPRKQRLKHYLKTARKQTRRGVKGARR